MRCAAMKEALPARLGTCRCSRPSSAQPHYRRTWRRARAGSKNPGLLVDRQGERPDRRFEPASGTGSGVVGRPAPAALLSACPLALRPVGASGGAASRPAGPRVAVPRPHRPEDRAQGCQHPHADRGRRAPAYPPAVNGSGQGRPQVADAPQSRRHHLQACPKDPRTQGTIREAAPRSGGPGD